MIAAYAAVVAAMVAITASPGMTAQLATRLAVIGLIAIELALLPVLRARRGPRPARTFIALATGFALCVELAHMISQPLDPSLVVDGDTPVLEIARRVAIDLVFTAPSYVVVFAVEWSFIRRYRYSVAEIVLVMGFGQALGDGAAYFTANPAMLLWLPYVATNYHAMTVVPYLLVRDDVSPAATRSRRRFVALLVLPILYVALGFAIRGAARLLGVF